MVIVNKLYKMVKCIFMDSITIKNTAKAFYDYIWKNHGFFSFANFDRGRTFVSYFWDKLITRFVIKKTFPRLTTEKLMDKRKFWNSFSSNILKLTSIFWKTIKFLVVFNWIRY